MRTFVRALGFLSTAMVALPAFAEGAEKASSGGLNYLSAGLAIGLAVLGGGTGQGRAAASAYEGIGRNPQSAGQDLHSAPSWFGSD